MVSSLRGGYQLTNFEGMIQSMVYKLTPAASFK